MGDLIVLSMTQTSFRYQLPCSTATEIATAVSGFHLLEELWLGKCLRDPHLGDTHILREAFGMSRELFQASPTLRSIKFSEECAGTTKAYRIKRHTIESVAGGEVSLENVSAEVFDCDSTWWP